MIVNGKKVALQTETPLKAYLETSGCDPSKVAVEKNGVIIAAASFASEILTDSDTLEIVCFVGGG